MVAAPAVETLRDFHLTALQNAYALMSAAAETAKPHACWAHHTAVGGARTADQLVEQGLLSRRLDAHKHDINTFRYRITPEGCAALGRPCLMKEIPDVDTPSVELSPELTSDTVRRIAGTLNAAQLHMLMQIADVVPVEPRDLNARHMLIERALVTPIGDANHWTHTVTTLGKQVVDDFLRADAASVATAPDVVITDDDDEAPEPPVAPALTPALKHEIDELRFDREALIETQVKLEVRVKDAETAHAVYKRELDEALSALHAIRAALADADGVVPDDPLTAITALRETIASKDLHIADLDKLVDTGAASIAELHEEVDALRREANGLKIQLSQAAGTERGIEYERDIDVLSSQIQQRELAGWSAWHKWNDGPKLIVEWRRDPSAKRKAKQRPAAASVHVPPVARPYGVPAAPATPAPVSTALTGDAFIMPEEAPRPSRSGFLGDVPADPFWQGKRARPSHERVPRSAPPRSTTAPTPVGSVMDAFSRNLERALEANPIPPATPLSHFTRS